MSEDDLWELVPSFYHVDPKNEAQVMRLSGRCQPTELSGWILIVCFCNDQSELVTIHQSISIAKVSGFKGPKEELWVPNLQSWV